MLTLDDANPRDLLVAALKERCHVVLVGGAWGMCLRIAEGLQSAVPDTQLCIYNKNMEGSETLDASVPLITLCATANIVSLNGWSAWIEGLRSMAPSGWRSPDWVARCDPLRSYVGENDRFSMVAKVQGSHLELHFSDPKRLFHRSDLSMKMPPGN